MKQIRRWQRNLILSLLCVSVFVPIVFFSNRLKNLTSVGGKEFVEDLSNIKYRTDALKLNSIEQVAGELLKAPADLVYKDGDIKPGVGYNASNEKLRVIHEDARKNESIQPKILPIASVGKEHSSQKPVHRGAKSRPHSIKVTDEKVKEMRDQVIRAKAFLNFASPNNNVHLVKELRLRIREVERALGDATKDSDLSRSALQKMKSMNATLLKASRVYTDCSAMANKLRAMAYNAEDLVKSQRNQATFLVEVIAGRSTPKGIHCLSMWLTKEYMDRQPEDRQLPSQEKIHDPDLYHYAVFSDNILACAVVVNSTASNAVDSSKIVFHIVTDSLNLPAISMWFLLNPPGKATIQIQSIDNLDWLPTKYGSTLEKQSFRYQKYNSPLNHLRFYLPDVFPELNKIVLLDHDVVVQKDLTQLWSVDLKGKVIGAVESCNESEPSFRRLDMFVDFSDPTVAERFAVDACTWAFGMNLFDLREWRRRNLTSLYHEYLELGNTEKRPLKLGSLPLGWLTFYNQSVALDRRWHALGLGYDSGMGKNEIEQAAVIHYDGLRKPWSGIGLHKYNIYWTKYVNYDHPFLQKCNIHG